MELVIGKVQESRIDQLHHEALKVCDRIQAAVAYISSANHPFFTKCLAKNIPLQLWARIDHTVPVALDVLAMFLTRKSASFECKLVPSIFHPKVIWWHGFGAYIGSANLTDSAWFGNIEAGTYFTAEEIEESGMRASLEEFFDDVDRHALALTDELYAKMDAFAKANSELHLENGRSRDRYEREFELPKLASLTSVTKRPANERRRTEFLAEWDRTLQYLRNIADKVSQPQYRPDWVPPSAAKGVQADQFLHAYYYTQVKEGQEIPYYEFHHRNKNDPEAALIKAMKWWKKTKDEPTWERTILTEWAPSNTEMLKPNRIEGLDGKEFVRLCSQVHAIREHAVRSNYRTYGLTSKLPRMTQDQRIEYHGNWLFRQKSKSGRSTLETIAWVLYGGSKESIPERIWEICSDPSKKVPHLGVSALGEIVGWAFPNFCPPRNGRTSKALTALGYRVAIHSE